MLQAFAFDIILDVVAFKSLNCLWFLCSICSFTFPAFSKSSKRVFPPPPPPFFFSWMLALLCACECGFFMNYGIMCTIKIVIHLQYIIIFAWSNWLSFTKMQGFFKHFKFYLCIHCSWCFWFLCVPADIHFSFILCDFFIITYTEESGLNSFRFCMSVKAFTALMFENIFAEYRGQR